MCGAACLCDHSRCHGGGGGGQIVAPARVRQALRGAHGRGWVSSGGERGVGVGELGGSARGMSIE